MKDSERLLGVFGLGLFKSSVEPKEEIMARFVISGHTATLVSSVKLADIKKAQAFDPEVLCLKDENGEPVFGVAVAKYGDGDVGAFGVEFAPQADLNGFAIASIKLVFDEDTAADDVKRGLAENFAGTLTKLGEIEDAIPASLTAIDLKIEKAMAKIEVL